MVSILLIVENYLLSRYCIETFLKNCKVTEVEILVVSNLTDSAECELLDKFLVELVEAKDQYGNVCNTGLIEEITPNKAAAYNKLIKEAKGEYICIFDSLSLVGGGWLFDLISHREPLPKAGISAIPYFGTKKSFVGVIDKSDEQIIETWQSTDKTIDGIALLSKDVLNSENCFDAANEKNFLSEFAINLSKHGFVNFYVPGQIAISINK